MASSGHSMRLVRLGTLIAWFVAIGSLAVVFVEVINRWIEPDLQVSHAERSTDPRAAARQISARVAIDADLLRTAPGLSTTDAEDGGYVLVGLATGFGEAPGFAMLRATSGEVVSLMLGESLPSGATVIEIQADHVTLNQRGSLLTIRIPRDEAPGIAPSTDRADGT